MNTGPARGMRDFLPEDVRRRQYVIGVIADVYQKYGFEPLETPSVENLETLQGKYGEEGDRLIFKILKRGEGAETGQADLALRYDLTVPLARVVAEYRSKLPKFFKRYQVQPVWRADRPQKGRFREFYQCDVDAIGSTSMTVEAELLSAAADVFVKLGFTDFQIVVNHRKLLNALLAHFGVPLELHGPALVILDKADKIGHDAACRELRDKGLSTDAAGALLGQLVATSGIAEVDYWLAAQADILNDEGKTAANELRQLFSLCQSTSAGPYLALDRSLARGLSYYTGPIFEVRVPDLAGSLGGGGRYDTLIGMFSGQSVPACGISLGLERMLVVMSERGMFSGLVHTGPADVMVTLQNWESANQSLTIAGRLRAAGLRTEVYPSFDKLGKQLQYASTRKIKYAVIVPETSSDDGKVNIRNVVTGKQDTIDPAALESYVKRRILLNSDEDAWAIKAPKASISEDLDDSVLCVRLGAAANAIGAAQRLYVSVKDARGATGEQDRLTSFLLAAGYVSEALRTLIEPNLERIQDLAKLGSAPDDLIDGLTKVAQAKTSLGKTIQRIRNKVAFHWDDDVVRGYLQRFNADEVEWALGIGDKQGQFLFEVSANAITNSLLPDDEPEATDERNLQRLKALIEEILPVMQWIVLLSQHVIVGHTKRSGAKQSPY